MKLLLSIFLILFSIFSFSQTQVKDTTTRKATILFDKKGNQVQYNAEVPTLNQILGAPKANYSYFWEMGDGSYSKEPAPKKTYKKKGDYKVNLSVTNNYDNGKPPKTRPQTVAINEISDLKFDQIASLPDTISLKIFNNREPVPNDEIVVVISYKNELNYLANGKIYLFYNDKEFKNKNFELLETRTHFGEREVTQTGIASVENNDSYRNLASTDVYPSFKNGFNLVDENLEMTLAESNTLFSDSKAFEFDNMEANETRNMFFTFKTTPEMLKDTSAIVKMRSVFVPDRNYKNHKKKTLQMEIVTSHDPNKMSSNATLMNYRTVRFKTINFKTRFQNNGEGPARMIRLETDTPDMFEKKTLQIVDSYPKCPICPKGQEVTYSCLDTLIKKKQIHFTFKNIYIPGSNQKNVKEVDSTKGFVKYTMRFAKDFHKQKTRSQTAIIFDKNEPVITNIATTRFKSGISIGVRAGFNLYSKPELSINKETIENISSQERPQSYFIGATISPYKSYRWYWQSELYYTTFKNENLSQIGELVPVEYIPGIPLSNGTIATTGTSQTTSKTNTSKSNMEIVPVSLRYNVNNYIGIGFGPQFSANLNQKTETETETRFFYRQDGPAGFETLEFTNLKKNETTSETVKPFKEIQTSVFADVTFGFARIGPSVGARYYKSFEQDSDYWQFYAIWKF
ncbi:MAG: PKD domain-containing protein [Flavobacterium sp.]|uniref:PKD domain-containing protein n=1 Tax=Flavobacterium sp. TaxID=239 RepID=UPI0022C09055|nr:PKD domain-containing protein [Flavobacterium sp.]MCZ8196145.1 PKD domain-containing protein [Flavobacterium sp.]